VQVANGLSRGTSEVLVIGLHIVSRFEYGFVIKVEYGFVIKALENLWSKKNRGASLLFFFILFYFLLFFSLSFLFILLLFLTFLFFSSYIFFIFHFFLLQHNTYIAFVRDDVMIPPPCLNDARPRAQMRGEMTAKVSINSIILQNIWISIKNFTPYSNWLVDKEVITKRCFWFRVDAQWSLWNFRCENPQCMDKKASMKKLHKGMTSFLVSNHRNRS
jgi:Ca2+/Na+ antiporter